MTQRYDTILWDVDQTLLDFKKSESYAIRHCFDLFGLKADDKIVSLYSSINEKVWKKIEKSEIEKKEALIERFDTLFYEIGITGLDTRAFQLAYGDALGSVYYFQDNSYELMEKLKGNYRQYLVTNGVTKIQMKKLKLSGLDQLAEGIFISEEIGAPKPQKAYFDKCFSCIPDFDKGKTIIVGDSLTSDMKGGNNAQISTCWYNPQELKKDYEVAIDFEITNLNDIIPILEGDVR